jgi:hypothetical protein
LLQFLAEVTLNDGRRLILKSPLGTCRVHRLVEVFPDARFVYTVRDPYAVYPSTVRLWSIMYAVQGLQVPRYETLDEYILHTFQQMHRSVEEARRDMPPSRFCQVRYEDLVADPKSALQRIYRQLELGDFQPAQSYVDDHLAEIADYTPNTYELSHADREKISIHWRSYIEQHGYDAPVPPHL